MMKRGGIIVLVFLFSLFIFSGFGSAFWPFDYFKNIFTGNVIMQVEYTCGNYSLSTPSNAVASSSYSSQYSAGKANDGSASTSWVSSALSGPHWIYFDLGSKRCINKVNLFVDYNYLPMAVNVQVSDGAINWSNVVIRKGEDSISIESSSTEITFDKIEGRYIRIYETENVQSSGPPEANMKGEVITIVAQIVAQMFEYGSLGEIIVNSAPRIATASSSSNTTTKVNCYDSDANATYPTGLNYYKSGIADNRVNSIGSWYEDRCLYLNQTGERSWQYVQVDNCFGGNCTLQEGYCSGNSVSNIAYKCPYGCVNGACISQYQCIDSDGGINYSVRGNVISKEGFVSDMCYDDSLLLEMFCGVGGMVFSDGNGAATIDRHECGEGMKCDDGRCLNEGVKYGLLQDFELIRYLAYEEGIKADIVDAEHARLEGFVNGASIKYSINKSFDNSSINNQIAAVVLEYSKNITFIDFKKFIDSKYKMYEENFSFIYTDLSDLQQLLLVEPNSSKMPLDKSETYYWTSGNKLIEILVRDKRVMNWTDVRNSFENLTSSYLDKYISTLLSEEKPQEPVVSSENLKNMSKYSEREVFLISDKNWKDILPLVPVTTWTGNETNCTRGYGTPENVCVYPTLIYHEEDNNDLYIDVNSFWGGHSITSWVEFDGEGGSYFDEKEVFPRAFNLNSGQEVVFKLKIKTNEIIKNVRLQEIPDFMEFIEPANGIINNINSAFPEGKTFEFVLKVKDNATDKKQVSFDADSIIYFMQQYQNNNKEKVTIVGNSPEELGDLLIAQPELGAGIQQNNIKRINPQNYLSYWKSYKDVVYVEDNYELALMASTYASLINAPLIIQGSSLDNSSTFSGRNVTCVGNVDKNCNEKYNLEQLQKKYVELTKTDKIILVNPNDLNIKVEEAFQPEKSTNRIFDIYTKSSITSPILAGAKHEVIIPQNKEPSPTLVSCSNFKDIIEKINEWDSIVENKSSILSDPNYLTIVASPNAIPQSFNEDCNSDSFFYTLKQAVDDVYSSSPNYNSIMSGGIGSAIDSNGIIHMVEERTIDKQRNKILYWVLNGSDKSVIRHTVFGNDLIYAYNPKIKVDALNNIHILFRGMKMGKSSFELFYLVLDNRGDIIYNISFAGEEKEVPYNKLFEVDKEGDAYITYFRYNDSLVMEAYLAKLSKGGVIFTRKLPLSFDYNDMDVIFVYNNTIEIDRAIRINEKVNNQNVDREIINYTRFSTIDGSFIGSGSLFDDPHSFPTFIASTYDNFGNPIILSSGYYSTNFIDATPSYFLYSNFSWRRIKSSDLKIVDSIKLDSKNYLHAILIGGSESIYYINFSLYEDLISEKEIIPSYLKKPNMSGLFYEPKSFLIHENKNALYIYSILYSNGLRNEGNFERLPEYGSDKYFIIEKNEFNWSDPLLLNLAISKSDFNMNVGRIYGLTSSDTSSYIARSVFGDSFKYSKKSGMSIGHSFEDHIESARKITLKMRERRYDWECFTDAEDEGVCKKMEGDSIDRSYFTNKYFITYSDHGSSDGWWKVLYFSQIPLLNLSFAIGDACSTNDFEEGLSNTFGVRFLRKGGIGYIGSAGVSWDTTKQYYINNEYINKKYADVSTDLLIKKPASLGELHDYLGREFGGNYKDDFILYGDPTIEVALNE